MQKTLGKMLGPFGEILAVVYDNLSKQQQQQVDEEQIRTAIKVLTEAGFDVSPGGTKSIEVPELRVSTVPTVGRPKSPIVGQDDDDGDFIRTLPTIAAPHIDDQSDEDVLSNMIETPESSNIFAFGYDHHEHILYVQYKADGPITHRTGQINQCNREMAYMMGHRAHTPGPVYAYGSKARPIPEQMFDSMKSASSKGEWVWQNLRVCGSQWQHQYPYILVTPSMANGKIYIPRKATRHGFRVRTVPTVGFGKRGFSRSNLRGYNEKKTNAVF